MQIKKSNIKYINKDLLKYREKQKIYNKIFNDKSKTIDDLYIEEMYNKLKDDDEWKITFKIYSKLNRDNNKKLNIKIE